MDKSRLQIAKDAIKAAIAMDLMTEEDARKMIQEADAVAMRSLSINDTEEVLRATERLQDTLKRQKVGPMLSRTIVAAVGRLADERMQKNGERE